MPAAAQKSKESDFFSRVLPGRGRVFVTDYDVSWKVVYRVRCVSGGLRDCGVPFEPLRGQDGVDFRRHLWRDVGGLGIPDVAWVRLGAICRPGKHSGSCGSVLLAGLRRLVGGRRRRAKAFCGGLDLSHAGRLDRLSHCPTAPEKGGQQRMALS